MTIASSTRKGARRDGTRAPSETGRARVGKRDTGPGGQRRLKNGRLPVEYDTSAPLSSFVRVGRAVLISPQHFFTSIATDDSRQEQRAGPPVAFAVAATLLFFVFGGAYEVVLRALRGELSSVSAFGIDGLAAVAILVPVLGVLYALAAVIGLYVGAFFVHIPVMIFAGEDRRGYYSTLKITAYASVTVVLTWLPLAWVIASLYGTYLTAVGVHRMHCSTPLRTAVIAALVVAAGVGSLFVGTHPTEMILSGGLG